MAGVGIVNVLDDAASADAVRGVADHLAACGLPIASGVHDADAVIVWADRRLPDDVLADLLTQAAPAKPLLLAGPTLAAHGEAPAVADAAGLVPGSPTPSHPFRLRPGPDAGEVAARLDELELTDAWLRVEKARDDVEVLLTAMSGLVVHPVMTWRPVTGVGVLSFGSRATTLRDPAYLRLVHRWVRHALGLRDAPPLRVGLLGYGAIGDEHARALVAVDGLELAAVCDTNPARVDAARLVAPDLTSYADGEDLLAADLDLVVVSTPPNTHADWALRTIAAGKHVVVEKPFCITTAEADEMLAAAESTDRLLAVYQNRRWDADYLVLRRLLREGAVGEVFHYESFIGGYGHPCNFWHSDEEVSGGAIYDWGSHYLDWLLDLLPQDIAHVTAATHKRRWHDVTNADHTRVSVRFVDGVEAEFVHSDLAAAVKPKWFVLGTDGAIVGHWRAEADTPTALTLHQPDGSVTSVAVPPAPPYAFHRELADHLASGAPMSVTAAGSRRNIAVMEAAVTSAREGGRPVQPL
jgi:predicted dehydrogenase